MLLPGPSATSLPAAVETKHLPSPLAILHTGAPRELGTIGLGPGLFWVAARKFGISDTLLAKQLLSLLHGVVTGELSSPLTCTLV